MFSLGNSRFLTTGTGIALISGFCNCSQQVSGMKSDVYDINHSTTNEYFDNINKEVVLYIVTVLGLGFLTFFFFYVNALKKEIKSKTAEINSIKENIKHLVENNKDYYVKLSYWKLIFKLCDENVKKVLKSKNEKLHRERIYAEIILDDHASKSEELEGARALIKKLTQEILDLKNKYESEKSRADLNEKKLDQHIRATEELNNNLLNSIKNNV